MELYILLIILGLVFGYLFGYFISSKNFKEKLDFYKEKLDEDKNNFENIKDDFEKTFKALASDVAKSNSEEFLKLASEKFNNLIEQRKNEIENIITNLSYFICKFFFSVIIYQFFYRNFAIYQ